MSTVAPPESSLSRIVFGVLLSIIILVGGFFEFVIGGLAAMASDSCGTGNTTLICTVTGQWLITLIPMGCAILGVLLLIPGWVANYRRPSPWWFLSGLAVQLFGVAAVYYIAGTGP